MTFNDDKTAVLTAIEKNIGGKPSFELDELLLDHGFQGNYPATITAEVLIEEALEKAKAGAA